MKVVLVIPAYNEDKRVGVFLKSLPNEFEKVVIDDGSSDQTSASALNYTPYVLRHSVNLGKGAALKTGCEFAFNKLLADYVILMDADGQHAVEDLEFFIKALIDKPDLIHGVRQLSQNMPRIKRLSNKFASHLFQLLYGFYFPDIPSGYKAFSQKGYSKIKWQSKDYRVELEIAVKSVKARVKMKFVPISTIYHDCDKGFQFLDSLSQIWSLIKWRFIL